MGNEMEQRTEEARKGRRVRFDWRCNETCGEWWLAIQQAAASFFAVGLLLVVYLAKEFPDSPAASVVDESLPFALASACTTFGVHVACIVWNRKRAMKESKR